MITCGKGLSECRTVPLCCAVVADPEDEVWAKVKAREAAKAEPNCQVQRSPTDDNELF